MQRGVEDAAKGAGRQECGTNQETFEESPDRWGTKSQGIGLGREDMQRHIQLAFAGDQDDGGERELCV